MHRQAENNLLKYLKYRSDIVGVTITGMEMADEFPTPSNVDPVELQKNIQFNLNTNPKAKEKYVPPLLEPLPCLKQHQEKIAAQYYICDKVQVAEGATKLVKTSSTHLPPIDIAEADTDLPVALRGRKRTHRMKSLFPESYAKDLLKFKKFGKVETNVYRGMRDMNEVIKCLCANKDKSIGFFYLAHCVPKTSPYYHYYNLKVVHYVDIDRNNYSTISTRGVMKYLANNEPEFTELDEWQQDYINFSKIRKTRFFAQFQMWKPFKLWHKNIRQMKFKTSENFLRENLYMLNPMLTATILKIKEMCDKVSQMRLCKIEEDKTYAASQFYEAQCEQSKIIVTHTQTFRDIVKNIARIACRNAMLKDGFVPDDCHQNADGHTSLTVPGVKPKKNKYAVCQRLTSFIRYLDYIIVSALRQLVIDAVRNLLVYFTELLNNAPSFSRIITRKTDFNPESLDIVIVEADDESKVLNPLFRTDLLLKIDRIAFQPDVKGFRDLMNQIFIRYQQTALSVPNLLPDDYFNAFTRPIAYHSITEKTCGEGPNLGIIFEEDRILQNLKTGILDALESGFNNAIQYVNLLLPCQRFYQENESMNPEHLKAPKLDVDFYEIALNRYKRQTSLTNNIQVKMNTGVLLVDATNMKSLLIPSTVTLLNIVHDNFISVANVETNRLMHIITDSKFQLELIPLTTAECAKHLTFLDKIQENVETLAVELQVVNRIYDIITLYNVPISPEILAVYQILEPSFDAFRNTVDKALYERDYFINCLKNFINHDIKDLRKEVTEIKQEAMNPKILDINSNKNQVMQLLKKFISSMNKIVTDSETFQAYQKDFKIEVTDFDDLDELNQELLMKQKLWTAMEDWDTLTAKAMVCPFDSLDHEELQKNTLSYLKTCNIMQKSLPPNNIVGALKEKVEDMKEKLPVIMNLHNPALRARHWEQIQRVLGFSITPEDPLNLGKLIEWNSFEFLDEIQDISSQASSENGLEIILKKVENSWKKIEFLVLPYKDYADTFILGGTDDIQQILDDSIINISTIASSRYVGPIKSRVEEWQVDLELVGKTLDAWLLCQKMWLYLESIFSAPDIIRQLPSEGKMFRQVDKSFKDIMRKLLKRPRALRACLQPGLLEALQNNNALLNSIQKCLETYLEVKRLSFPRFYFLSNDELLEILAQTRNPLAVQPHMKKCFDAINLLDFGEKDKDLEDIQAHAETMKTIYAMISPEGEIVSLGRDLKTRGNVEDWLGKVEEAMFASIRQLVKRAVLDHDETEYKTWLFSFPNQVILTVSMVMWCRDAHLCLESEDNCLEMMGIFEQKCFNDLNQLAALVSGKLSKLNRATVCALITTKVNARDIISELVKKQVDSIESFDWQKQLRYYWDTTTDMCIIHMSNSDYFYGYEYLGASPRLVITPLTNRCYLCLMGALQLDLGGAPAGPAGTGKTETTKDLAKALAKQCVVFNCSDGLDYKMMGRFFSGLAQTGAWCCFDEFNRIDTEVLSVIAQQLITIRNAKVAKVSRFIFEGHDIKLIRTCAAFITMNPGYAGRTELPDNLKALFRPFAMMVPDYCLIAEVILYSEGFESSKLLAQKMTQMYKLCSEQLSQQDHYDFGMRAIKSILVMAGSLKQQNPGQDEDSLLIRALHDSNIPKFLKEDAILFQSILQDLFPGITVSEPDYGVLEREIIKAAEAKKLMVVPTQILKVIQLYDTMLVRHGVMLVGPTGGGKTTVYKVLADALGNLHALGEDMPFYQPVICYILNPKSISMEELYGGINRLTLEWHDGLMAIVIRIAVADTSPKHQWVISDGPVDALWIENMNTVLDDNKMLCLANSERIKLTPYIHMLFEVEDLAVASPATVSRCGMVYIDPGGLQWFPYVEKWMKKWESLLKETTKEFLLNLFREYVDKGFEFVRRNCGQTINQVNISKVTTLCKLYESLVFSEQSKKYINFDASTNQLNSTLCTTFMFCYVWAIGGNILESKWDAFDTFTKNMFDSNPFAKVPTVCDIWSVFMDFPSNRLELWEMAVPHFIYNKTIPFFNIFVPSVDTLRYGYLLEKLLDVDQSVLYIGSSGVGKSMIANRQITQLADTKSYVPVFINFSAQTSSKQTQDIIESKLEKRRKNVIGAPKEKRVIIFIDDINMPKLDTYGSQPPIELLRQYQDFKGFYERNKFTWLDIEDVTLSAACAPPGGGRNAITPRLVRHFSVFNIPPPAEHSLKLMFTAILSGFFIEFPQAIQHCVESIVCAAVEIYCSMKSDLLPTPTKSHYLFNLRDLSKCVQGVLQANLQVIHTKEQIFNLFCHEATRIFHDRLTDDKDRMYFHTMMADMASKHFGEIVAAEDLMKTPIIFGDYLRIGIPLAQRVYKQVVDMEKLKNILIQYLDDFNLQSPKEMKLVFFTDAISHISRIIRIIRQNRGNALLVGVGGVGKQSLTKLAAHICGYQCFQIELRRGYDYVAFRDDLKKLYELAGCKSENIVFLFNDTQIVMEEFLEDINNMLNSGEVPNLLEAEDNEKLINACRPAAKDVGIPEQNRDLVLNYAINLVRKNLHIVLCMSPVGTAFRSRCRMFPSLVNCCSIDWFTEWPEEALYSVAELFFEEADSSVQSMSAQLASVCVTMHISTRKISEDFYNALKRRYYITPTSYLELINLYETMLTSKSKEVRQRLKQVQNGLDKIQETNDLVDRMKKELVALEPELKEKSANTIALLENLVVDQDAADKVKKDVMVNEAIAKQKADETEAVAMDAQQDLDEALPALEGAIQALDALDKSDIAEIRVFSNPPELVRTVMEAVCILLHQKTDWQSAKSVLADQNFLKTLRSYDKDHIPDPLLRKLKVYIDNPKFFPEIVENVSKACKSLCMWVRAINLYAYVFRAVQPKQQRLAKAKEELATVMSNLRVHQDALAKVVAQIAALQKTYDESVDEKERLECKITQTAVRLKRATKLTKALADKHEKWKETVVEFDQLLGHIAGDVLISAGSVAYTGAFTNDYRHELITIWIEKCSEVEIPISTDFSLVNTLSNSYQIREWNSDGLPRDEVSIDNAVIVIYSQRWPLMIDPQEQANMWIKKKEAKYNLSVIKPSDTNLMRTLENCIRIGRPVLLEDVGEVLEPSLEPILCKQTYYKSGRQMIRLGDTELEYSQEFKLFMTTKLPNPHYLPEICIKVTIVNFTVTRTGLGDQVLSEVVQLEKPQLEEQRNQLITHINRDKIQLKSIEERILQLLFHSKGNILDNEDLINTLNESKVTSDVINQRLIEAEQTETSISTAREKYRPVAVQGSIIYFAVADMAILDPMYQFSLKYFKQLFNMTIEQSEKSENLETRLMILLREITEFIYKNVSRALFEEHKLVFSFLLCAMIMKEKNDVLPEEWNYFLRGAGGLDEEYPEKPDITGLTQHAWQAACDLSRCVPSFANLKEEIALQNLQVQIGNVVVNSLQGVEDLECVEFNEFNKRLTPFQKLIFIKTFQEEKTILAITNFVCENLGQVYIESPALSLPDLYNDMRKNIPLIFILSSGSDPMGAFLKFAKDKEYLSRLQAISLGQGQGPIAQAMIKDATTLGNWVFLQNCHLAQSWMPSMENIIRNLVESPDEIHDDFRLFLSSMPAKHFPISVLQNSIKVTNEPPKGLRANLKRTIGTITTAFFEEHILTRGWCKLVFGICFFHAIVQERKKFGPLGWNIRYDFADSDRECALLNFQLFCIKDIPWDTLSYITGEITYGGRITDNWDQRCLRTILKTFLHPTILDESYTYSPSRRYFAPPCDTIPDVLQYIDTLPHTDEPEIFGMNENANVTFHRQETFNLVSAVLAMQPRVAGGEMKSGDSIVLELIESIDKKIIQKLDIEQASKAIFELDEKGRVNSLTTVLGQEVDRFNKLLTVIKLSLHQLKQAIHGTVVMNLQLESMYESFLNNQVPQNWSSFAYPSLKSLASWVVDLVLRCSFIDFWIKMGQPFSFWLPGFFFPQGFLTGVLQNYARKYNLAIDRLNFNFTILPQYRHQKDYIQALTTMTFGEELDIDKEIGKIKDGVLVHGLFMDGFGWDINSMMLADSKPGEMTASLPMMHLEPSPNVEILESDYTSPLYKTAQRAGVLSTTGHSTNFVFAVQLPSNQPQDYWIAKGAALICQLSD
ncbi:dynein heavy chain 6, axonemal-like [Octopus sinensis]|uniref:Dynein heavy chain 6, axonemal-like n=1 Tax=Octopus sinensis TaxID=2607531 RepID=A0A7E6FC35_9MOLL|nr:dynein heavy chain 6, axonemal-like [Octopus sinensis]